MAHIDIDSVSREYNISLTVLGDILFPNAKYKRIALDRVRNRTANLDIEQASNLATYLNTTIDELLKNPSWKGSRENGYLTITRDNYKVVLNKDGYYYSVYDGDILIDRIVEDLSPMPLDNFITRINNLINTYENNGI